ncbi:MAG TPA: hypothetical protein V6D34_16410 [Candidatus Sericytochromatia bacterium]
MSTELTIGVFNATFVGDPVLCKTRDRWLQQALHRSRVDGSSLYSNHFCLESINIYGYYHDISKSKIKHFLCFLSGCGGASNCL